MSAAGSWWPVLGLGPPRSPDDETVAVLADELRALASAGLPAQRCWDALAEHATTAAGRAIAAGVVAGRRRGDGAATSLLAEAPGPVPDALVRLAVVLEVSDRTGATLSDALAGLAGSLRSDAAARADREAALAGPRTTAGLLAVLPVAGLGLGAALGARPWATLLVTAPGRVCLLTGALLWAVGRWWTARLVRAATLP